VDVISIHDPDGIGPVAKPSIRAPATGPRPESVAAASIFG
jgi:hypothetical protein